MQETNLLKVSVSLHDGKYLTLGRSACINARTCSHERKYNWSVQTKHVTAYVYTWNRRELEGGGGGGRNWKYTSSHDVEEHTQTVE